MLTIADIKEQIKNGASVRSIVEQALGRADAAREYNAVISTVRERALERADAIDAKLKAGEEAGMLAGVPFIAKDNFLTFGGKTTAASNMLRPFEAPYQSTAIERLEAEGAIVIAKANLDAYAHGGSTENSDFGPTKNPHDTTRVPGGSSGGSAAAVALQITPFALGTDTGGSIRQPASFTVVRYRAVVSWQWPVARTLLAHLLIAPKMYRRLCKSLPAKMCVIQPHSNKRG
jgi:aspartyl-tRNA(Asn)/glutamyl-tRNA(Gln) amidotransferase subunit A